MVPVLSVGTLRRQTTLATEVWRDTLFEDTRMADCPAQHHACDVFDTIRYIGADLWEATGLSASMHRNWFSGCSTPRRAAANIHFSHRLEQNS